MLSKTSCAKARPATATMPCDDEYCDMMERGIINPTKVSRSAVQNAASVASMLLTTESLVCDIPVKEAAPMPGAGDMGGMY